jgi:hypothetical protein
MVNVGAQALTFLYQAHAGRRFVFGGRATPVTINQLRNAGYVEEIPYDDEWYSPGMYRWTDLGAHVAKTLPHTLEIIPSPKMDSPDLVAAKCSCGYQSSATTEPHARHRWASHANNKGGNA